MMIPLYKQEFWYSCFATCVKMILEYHGVKKSERDLRILLKTTPTYGTLWEYAEREIKKMGFGLVWKKFWEFEEIKSLIWQSISAIVGVKGKTDIDKHAVVVTDTSGDSITIADPDNGELAKIGVQEFLNIWNERNRIAGYIKKI